MFIPVFKIGAALGRIVGEALHMYFPYGIRYGGHISPIIPGNSRKENHMLMLLYLLTIFRLFLK